MTPIMKFEPTANMNETLYFWKSLIELSTRSVAETAQGEAIATP
jgi:hypothetical protein